MTTPPTPPPTWQVTSQGPPTTQIQGGGNVLTGITVYFTTAAGVPSSIFVPDGAYNPASVKQMIAGKAAQLDEVAGLTGAS